jgi:signal transduction histidine kinase/ligand-binding sensor domain-containing protein
VASRQSRTNLLRFSAGILLLIFGVFRGTASAQYKIDTWTTEQGLPQATVINATQSPDGFIWASTLGGLARFDGLNFRVFDTVTNPELPNSRLGAALIDRGGEFWVATEDRRVLGFRDGRFQTIGPAQGLPDLPVTRFSRRDGLIVIENSAGAFTWQNGRFAPDTRPGPPASAGLKFVGNTFTGARWFIDQAGRGYRYDGDRMTKALTFPSDRGGLVYEDRAGRLWMRNVQTSELICVSGDTVRRYGRKDGVVAISTMWVLEDPDGTLWFAEGAGLVRFRDGRFRSFTKADGLPGDYVNSVFRDREGTHWVATQGGLARLTEQPITAYSVASGLAAKNTYPILQDRRGDIWIGGWSGLTRYRNGAFENVSRAAGLAGRGIFSLLEDHDGTVWVAYGGGVRRLTIGVNGDIHSSPLFEPWEAYAMYQGRGPDIWFGTTSGVRRYRNGVFEPWLPGIGAANTFYEDSHGALWIGTGAGLARYDNGTVTHFGESEGFSGRQVRMIYPDPDGALWLGTYDSGLFRYRNGTFTRFTTREGLPANGAFQILEDAQARFWISSNSGIYRVSKSELDDVADGRRRTVTAVRYGKDDGMANAECNGLGRPAGVRAADGRMWFPTQDGVAVIDPAALASSPAPPVALLDAAVGGFPVPSLDRIEIRSGSTSFQAHYAALTYAQPELAQFKYRMEGLETEWNMTTGPGRVARYAKLPFGNFRFHVIAANRDGVWNEEGASIPVDVIPPFWRTTWFMWLMTGMVMATGFGAHRVRLRVLERKQAVQQAFARQLIDSQETDRKRIASELHDGVSQTLVVIRNWSQTSGQSLPEDSPARKRLGDISAAASQALGEVREVVQDLVPYHLERVGLSEAIREAATRVADSSGIPITCTCPDLAGALSPEMSLRLFRVAQEALNNIVKHSRAASASVEITREPRGVRLAIRDNGKGFDPAAVTPTTAGDGFGLVGMSERVRMMGGDINIVSAPGHGTTITILVPSTDVDPHSDR